MPLLLWDASALAKRYIQEVGSPTVQELFAHVPLSQMFVTIWGYSETFSILLRRHNGGVISHAVFVDAVSALDQEFIVDNNTAILAIDNDAVFAGIDLMQAHNVNSADATILAVFLRYAAATSEPCIIVTADNRLVRAARAEGFVVINPETTAVEEISTLLSS